MSCGLGVGIGVKGLLDSLWKGCEGLEGLGRDWDLNWFRIDFEKIGDGF